MASRSSSSESTSNSSLSEDGSSEVMIVDQRRTLESERFFFMEKRLDNSHDEKGKAIITNFHEITGGKVVPTKFFKAESAHMAATNNPKATQEFEIGGARAPRIECGCCYWEFQLENMVHCSNGHMFCFKCLNRRVKEITYGGYKLYSSISCMATGGGCKESIPLSEIQRALPNDVIQRYEERQAQEAVAKANLERLVYCPFCNVPCEVDECAKVVDCPNPKCLRDSCIKCKKMSHESLWCEEFERINNAPLRMEVEERMAKAVIRECNICHVRFVKADECNKVKCRCGNTMCYVCRQTISSSDIIHFCDCYPASTELVKSCPRCNKCSFLWYEIEDNEALAAKEEALKEFAGRDPKLLDLEIGPPFEKLRQQVEHRPRKYQRIDSPQSSPAGLLRHAVERAVIAESPLSSPARLFREAMKRAFMVETPPSNPTRLPDAGNRRANNMSKSSSSSPTTAVSSANMVESPTTSGPSNEGIEHATMVNESPPSIPTILLREDIQRSTLLESPTSSPPRILFPESIQRATMVESPTSTPRILFREGTRRATMVESPTLIPRILFGEGVEAANMAETSPFSPAQFFIDEEEPTNVVERPPRVSTDDEH